MSGDGACGIRPGGKAERMVILAALVFGALMGWGVARRRGGRKLDQLQYAAGYGIAWGIVGVFVTILVGRMG